MLQRHAANDVFVNRQFRNVTRSLFAIAIFYAGVTSGVAAAAEKTYQASVSQGQQRWHYYKAPGTTTYDFDLDWSRATENLDLVVATASGSVLTASSSSSSGNSRENVRITLQAGQELFAKVFGRSGSGVGYTLRIGNGAAGGGASGGGSGSGGSTTPVVTFSDSLSTGRQRWHYFKINRTNDYRLDLQWGQSGGDADLVLTRANGSQVASAANSNASNSSERIDRRLNAGDEFFAKVFMRSGSNVAYQLTVAEIGNQGGGSSSGGSSSGGSGSSSSGGSGSSGGPPPPPAVLTYLDDANHGSVLGGGITSGMGYPRVMLTETQSLGSPRSRFGKYPIVAAQAANLGGIEALVRDHGNKYFRMFTPRITMEWLFESRGDCTQGLSLPFRRSAANTGNCDIWAGHFVYNAGSRLSSAMSANASEIRVDDASGFQVGKYIAIYDGGLSDFRNAEHVKITGKSGNRIFLGGRYKSLSRYRSSGSWVRQHQDYNNNARFWVFNMATTCPRDPNGRTLVDYMVSWLADNIKRDVDGQPRNVSVSGLTFDVDTYIDVFTTASDVNNDLQADGGVSPAGVHWWGEGVDGFYRRIRQRFSNFVIVGGVHHAFGFDSLNGVQIEGFPNGPRWRPLDDYSRLNHMMSTYLYRMRRSPRAPAMVQLLMKNGTSLYPTHNVSRYGNAPARLGLALTSMDAGFFHHENNTSYEDTWYDEYAVVSNRGASDFGRAVDKSNISKVRANLGWLGDPVNDFSRVVDATDFSLDQALVRADFDSGSAWSSRNVSAWRTTSQKKDGSHGLAISRMPTYQRGLWQASVTGPSVNLQQGSDYTVVFAARASDDRWIRAALGSHGEDFLVGPNWRRYVMSFRSNDAGSRALSIQVGQHLSEVYIDSVYVFRGNANVFRRDFQRGSVIANATPRAVSLQLGSGYRRIRGNQDPINSGADLPNIVTIPAYDGLFALKK